MYESLMNVICSNNIDMACASWFKEFEDKSVIIKNKRAVKTGIFYKNDILEYVYHRDDYQGFAYMWDKIYSRKVIFPNGKAIMFDESLQLGGDVLYLGKLLLNVNTASYIDKSFYHYRQRKDSGCHTLDLNKRFDWLKAYEYLLQTFNQNAVSEDIILYVKRFYAYHASNVAEIALNQKNKTALAKAQKIMQDYHKEYFSTNSDYPDRLERYDSLLKAEIKPAR